MVRQLDMEHPLPVDSKQHVLLPTCTQGVPGPGPHLRRSALR